MSETVVSIKKVIIATAIESIKLKIQRLNYWTTENSWMNIVSKECSCVHILSVWKQALDYLESLSTAVTMKLVRNFHYEIKNERTHVCQSHLQTLDQRLRLMTEQLAERILLNQVKTMYEYWFHLEHLKIDTTLIK